MKSERVGRFCKLAGSEFQTVGTMKLTEGLRVTNRFEIAFRGFQKLLVR